MSYSDVIENYQGQTFLGRASQWSHNICGESWVSVDNNHADNDDNDDDIGEKGWCRYYRHRCNKWRCKLGPGAAVVLSMDEFTSDS